MNKPTSLLIIVLFSILPGFALQIQAQQPAPYLIPLPNSKMVLPATTIAVRPGGPIDAHSVTPDLFRVEGSLSGLHAGLAVLSDDQQTVIFKPAAPFALGETVTVQLTAGLKSTAGNTLDGTAFSFEIAPELAPQTAQGIGDLPAAESPHQAAAPAAVAANQYVSKFLTLPASFPVYTLTIPVTGTADGSVFMAPFPLDTGITPYLLILDNSGQPVYYKQMPPPLSNSVNADFTRQPSGILTYWDGNLSRFVGLDSSYTQVNTYTAGNGFPTDLHELQILPNGHILILGNDDRQMDMSPYGGHANATVIGIVVQELDAAKNVVFEWNSWEHFQLTDSYEPLTGTVVDPVHSNAVALDNDGNILLSSRSMDEITKINRQDGSIIWRLGGKNNQFIFNNDTRRFAHQHDIRRLANGDITLFDNHNGGNPLYSRAVEYTLNEISKTATLAWQFDNGQSTYGFALGDVQRLPNGNTLIGWGASNTPVMSELKPDNSKAFELSILPGSFNYRAFRFVWHGYPTTQPTLVTQTAGATTTLAYSWNGATEIASYKIYGGDAPNPTDVIATQPKTGFEDHTLLVNEHRYCHFRVMPVDNQGHDTQFSNEVYTGQPCTNHKYFFPTVMN